MNMGEANATVVTGFGSLGLPSSASDLYEVKEVWSGATVKLKGDETIATTALRMHASVLYAITPAV
jgi:hypothetical protein